MYIKTTYMAKLYLLTTIAQMLLMVVAMSYLQTAEAYIGACYGTLGNNLPQPAEVIDLCKKHNINRIRLYNPNQLFLQALNSNPNNISLIVGVPNEEIQGIASNPGLAKSWVQNNVLKYPNVKFSIIAVGNEISPSEGAGSAIAPSVARAMENIHKALPGSRKRKVKVSTALSMGVLGQSYPPSAGTFRPDFRPNFIDPIINFLKKTKSPFLINVYPYFAYINDLANIRKDYALFKSSSPLMTDGSYKYQNLFDAMVDSVNAALEKAGGGNLRVVVSETGWPSAGGTSATIDNARTYNSNLIRNARKGTPRKPSPMEVYIFALIDENQKGPETEKHWGVFLPNKQPKYPLKF